MKRRETFLYIGDGLACATDDLLGKTYADDRGNIGIVVGRSELTVTVEFDMPLWSWLLHKIGLR